MPTDIEELETTVAEVEHMREVEVPEEVEDADMVVDDEVVAEPDVAVEDEVLDEKVVDEAVASVVPDYDFLPEKYRGKSLEEVVRLQNEELKYKERKGAEPEKVVVPELALDQEAERIDRIRKVAAPIFSNKYNQDRVAYRKQYLESVNTDDMTNEQLLTQARQDVWDDVINQVIPVVDVALQTEKKMSTEFENRERSLLGDSPYEQDVQSFAAEQVALGVTTEELIHDMKNFFPDPVAYKNINATERQGVVTILSQARAYGILKAKLNDLTSGKKAVVTQKAPPATLAGRAGGEKRAVNVITLSKDERATYDGLLGLGHDAAFAIRTIKAERGVR